MQENEINFEDLIKFENGYLCGAKNALNFLVCHVYRDKNLKENEFIIQTLDDIRYSIKDSENRIKKYKNNELIEYPNLIGN